MNENGFGPAVLDKSSDNSIAIQGREQQLIEANGGSQWKGGTSGNTTKGTSDTNMNRSVYTYPTGKEF